MTFEEVVEKVNLRRLETNNKIFIGVICKEKPDYYLNYDLSKWYQFPYAKDFSFDNISEFVESDKKFDFALFEFDVIERVSELVKKNLKRKNI